VRGQRLERMVAVRGLPGLTRPALGLGIAAAMRLRPTRPTGQADHPTSTAWRAGHFLSCPLAALARFPPAISDTADPATCRSDSSVYRFVPGYHRN
jgi:hypothetical protein